MQIAPAASLAGNCPYRPHDRSESPDRCTAAAQLEAAKGSNGSISGIRPDGSMIAM
jgi:hypothetical protein